MDNEVIIRSVSPLKIGSFCFS
ncbi:MAG: hypothetical protein WDM78_06770 [Puia sp.]